MVTDERLPDPNVKSFSGVFRGRVCAQEQRRKGPRILRPLQHNKVSEGRDISTSSEFGCQSNSKWNNAFAVRCLKASQFVSITWRISELLSTARLPTERDLSITGPVTRTESPTLDPDL